MIEVIFGIIAGFLIGWIFNKKDTVIIETKTGKDIIDENGTTKDIETESDDEAMKRFKDNI